MMVVDGGWFRGLEDLEPGRLSGRRAGDSCQERAKLERGEQMRSVRSLDWLESQADHEKLWQARSKNL